MRICNAKLYLNGIFTEGGLEFGEDIIAAGSSVTDGDIDAGGRYLIPGLVDIHSHAAMNVDASDGDPAAFPILSRYYASRGVTSWCPTTMTLPEDTLLQAMRAVRAFERPADGARLAGVNLEGPFLSAAKRGAQAAEHLRAPDIELFRRLNEESGGLVRLITIAPEEPGAIAFIEEASKVCAVSLGHTAADYDTAMAAYRAGASHTTHLFNAMPPIHHRDPGVIIAAADSGAYAELICDGFHIHPAVVRIAFRLFGEKLCLISDSMRCAGMPDGEYSLGGLPVTVKDGRCTNTGTDTIAGSSIHLMDALQRSIAFGIPPEQAVYAATAAPAKAAGLFDTVGELAPGKHADFVLLDEDFNPAEVWIAGQRIS